VKSLPLIAAWDGTEDGKSRLHREIAQVLRALAGALDLSIGRKGDCEIDSNPCGPAIGGYVYLRADSFHLWVDCGSRGEWGPSRGLSVTARKVRRRDDHVGSGPNVSLDWELLWDPHKLAEVLALEGVASKGCKIQ
jgi:hypothetical protein